MPTYKVFELLTIYFGVIIKNKNNPVTYLKKEAKFQ